MDPYKLLGVKESSSPDDIIKAYKNKAKKLHPDMPGGSDEAFEAIKAARDALLDPVQRKMFDEHGFVPGFQNNASLGQAEMELKGHFTGLLAQTTEPRQLEMNNIVHSIGMVLQQQIVEIASNLQKLEEQEGNMEKYKAILEKRLKKKNKEGTNIFMSALVEMEARIKHGRIQLENNRRIKTFANELLQDYDFESIDLIKSQQQGTTSAFNSPFGPVFKFF